MKNILYNREYLYKLYGADEDVALILQEFLNSYGNIRNTLIDKFQNCNLKEFMDELHANSPGFLYMGFSGISESIKELYTRCKTITFAAEIQADFSALLSMIDGCKEICVQEVNRIKHDTNLTPV